MGGELGSGRARLSSPTLPVSLGVTGGGSQAPRAPGGGDARSRARSFASGKQLPPSGSAGERGPHESPRGEGEANGHFRNAQWHLLPAANVEKKRMLDTEEGEGHSHQAGRGDPRQSLRAVFETRGFDFRLSIK